MGSGGYSPLALAYLVEISFILNIAYHELKSYKLSSKVEKKIQGYFGGLGLAGLAEEVQKLDFLVGTEKDLKEYLHVKEALMKFGDGEGDGWRGNRRNTQKWFKRWFRRRSPKQQPPEERRHDKTLHCKYGGCRNQTLCFALRWYYKLLRGSKDKLIVECCLVVLVVMLLGLTICEATNFHEDCLYYYYPEYYPQIWKYIWLSLFVVIAFTIVVATAAMYLGRQLRRFVLGHDHDPDDAESWESNPGNSERGRVDMLGRDFNRLLTQLSNNAIDNINVRQ